MCCQTTPIRDFGVGQQQLVEIAKHCNKDVQLFNTYDEPDTSSLTTTEKLKSFP